MKLAQNIKFLFIPVGLFLIVFPIVQAIIEPSIFNGLLGSYRGFFNTELTKWYMLVLLTIIIIALSVLVGSRFKGNDPKLRIVIGILVALFVLCLDLLIEHPRALGHELFFGKSIESKIFYQNNEYHESLSPEEVAEIYQFVLNRSKPYNSLILGEIINLAGSHFYDRQKYAMNPDVVMSLQKKWASTGQKHKVIPTKEEYLDEYLVVVGDYFDIITFSPIKQVDGRIFLGYESYSTPLGALGAVIEIRKIDGLWREVSSVVLWVS